MMSLMFLVPGCTWGVTVLSADDEKARPSHALQGGQKLASPLCLHWHHVCVVATAAITKRTEQT